jgi:hypothetical protein
MLPFVFSTGGREEYKGKKRVPTGFCVRGVSCDGDVILQSFFNSP